MEITKIFVAKIVKIIQKMTKCTIILKIVLDLVKNVIYI
jgi:hypothetical protein